MTKGGAGSTPARRPGLSQQQIDERGNLVRKDLEGRKLRRHP